ncbi:MAG: hypothetical protein A2754_02150 [Candidatus Magasanikbacteria bacterium RIFCSPHIGHO2_01_FULL_47_8]|uniref:Uncharacterized protein n=1 Tax=Candidatus Magasanikbacteria bacterium RIFCSPHIGHO2_01_FULL_47_8 TaxID=1798673 RepID=A0A1F6MEU3_9BACT|nr:MAG: hypothetical protein A2754_02150 [Candidatus Magasanikbacteria bacterium RIFCSPHIGHO2_01_FULL_47_8]
MFRKLILVLAVSFVFLPNVALMAPPAKIPEFNPLCWRQKACQDQRKQLNSEAEPKDGWISDDECALPDWGKCLPAGVATTQIAFGGQKRFLHIGDFIQVIYKYAVGVAGVVAVTMIIIAGFQWVTSGGNSEAITSAKKRITGALTGLFIAYAAFFILNTINPALVNLRLPQVYMIRAQSIVPRFCGQAPDEIKNRSNAFALATEKDKQLEAVKTTKDTKFDKTYKGGEKDFGCGKRFFMDSAGTTCWGDYCNAGQICVNFDNGDPANPNKYDCKDGMLAGRIGGNVGGTSNIQIENNMKLIALCKDGAIKQVGSDIDVNTSKKPQYYTFPSVSASGLEGSCGKKEDLVGFYMGVEGNDETGGTGSIGGEGGVFAGGEDDWFAVGQTGPGSHNCSINLAQVVFQAVVGSPPACTTQECTCSLLSALSKNKDKAKDITSKAEVANHLISLDELTKGYTCDIVLNRDSFPAAQNTKDKDFVSSVLGPGWGDWKGSQDLTDCFAQQ